MRWRTAATAPVGEQIVFAYFGPDKRWHGYAAVVKRFQWKTMDRPLATGWPSAIEATHWCHLPPPPNPGGDVMEEEFECPSCGALPCDQTQRPEPTARQFINHLARVAEAVGWQAGVGGMETAGGIVSYLADHPEDLEPFMNGGFFELPLGFHERGRLTWHGKNGKVVSPEYVRRSRQIKKMEKGL
jgi:hypothetical protein